MEEENMVEKKRKKKEVSEKKLEEKYQYYRVFPNQFLFEYYNLKPFKNAFVKAKAKRS